MKAARQSGFTLIELVVVITILGILAAFAIPRFAALDQQARIAARDALAGSVRSGAALTHAMWLAQGQSTTVPCVMEANTIAIQNAYPSRLSINPTLQDYAGFNYNSGTGVFSRPAPFASCTVTYTAPTAANLAPTIAVSAATNC